jgi:hypothetical protein
MSDKPCSSRITVPDAMTSLHISFFWNVDLGFALECNSQMQIERTEYSILATKNKLSEEIWLPGAKGKCRHKFEKI